VLTLALMTMAMAPAQHRAAQGSKSRALAPERTWFA
jgi:hypothetical protein